MRGEEKYQLKVFNEEEELIVTMSKNEKHEIYLLWDMMVVSEEEFERVTKAIDKFRVL